MQEKTLLALSFIRDVVNILPGTIEKLCFDTPAFYAGKNIFARVKEDEENLVLYTEERDKWMSIAPQIFFITAHYQNYKYMLVNLDLVEPIILEELLITAWKKRTTKTLLKQYLSQ
jgi:hypothetical protein